MPYPQHFIHKVLALITAASLLALTACGDKKEKDAAPATVGSAAPSQAASAAGAGAPVSVTTEKAQLRDMPVVLKATGTVTSPASVEVRAQVSSTVKAVHIHEGQFVKAGDLLFTLDARTDEANVAKARAQIAKDMAALADARRQLARAQQLLAQGFISQGALDTNQAQVEAQVAAVAADQAAIDAARVALSYARVVAQTAGRAGVIGVSAGSAVQANVTPLVTLTQLDPIAVAYSVPQRNLPDVLVALKGGGANVTASLSDGAGTFSGRLSFVDNAVDASSGAVKVKATFDNKAGQLWPGAFVEVTQTVSTFKDAVVIPQAAIIQTARGTIVYVNEQGKAALKPVKLIFAQGADAAVTGVQAGELVVMDGKQNLRPGAALVERASAGAKAASKAASKASAP